MFETDTSVSGFCLIYINPIIIIKYYFGGVHLG